MSPPQARRESANPPAEAFAGNLADWLRAEPFGLTLSSGYFGFFAHAGLLAALDDAKLQPSFVSGASAGALAGGLWAAGMAPRDFRDQLLALDKRDFWDPWPGLGLLRGKKFAALLRHWLPVSSFEDCRVPLAVSAFDVVGRRTRVFAEGGLAAAIHASCAVPLMFQPVWLQGRPYLDGGARDWAGIDGMPNDIPVLYHHLPLRMPWLSLPGSLIALPTRPRLKTVRIPGLARPSPNDLTPGATAFEQARAGMAQLLSQPAGTDVLEAKPPSLAA